MFSSKGPSPVINLAKKKLSSFSDDVIKRLDQGAATLVLTDNVLETVADGLLAPRLAVTLTVLWLDGNRLSAVPNDLFLLTSLTKLHLGRNRLDSLGEGKRWLAFDKLVKLHVNDNQLTVLPHELGALAKLTHLAAYNNPDLVSPPGFVAAASSSKKAALAAAEQWTARFLREAHQAASAPLPSADRFLFVREREPTAADGGDNEDEYSAASLMDYFLIDAAACTDQGRRPYQEDRFCSVARVRQAPWAAESSPSLHLELERLISKTGFFGVYDGHGGSQASEYLHRHLHRSVLNQAAFARGDFAEALCNGFRETDNALVRWCAEQRQPDGSTCVVALVVDNQLVTAHAGDSRCVLARRKKALRMTEDHKPYRADEMDRIHAARGKVVFHGGCYRVNGQLAVSRAFGDIVLKSQNLVISEPEINVETLGPDDDCAILASDGLWDVVDDQKAVDVARKCSTADDAAQKLVDLALKRNSSDNITVLVVKFNWSCGNSVQAMSSSRRLLSAPLSSSQGGSEDSAAEDSDNDAKPSAAAAATKDGGGSPSAVSKLKANSFRNTFRSVKLTGTARRPAKVAFKVVIAPATDPVLQHWPPGSLVGAVVDALAKKYEREPRSDYALYDARARKRVDDSVAVDTLADAGLLVFKAAGDEFPKLPELLRQASDVEVTVSPDEIRESAQATLEAAAAAAAASDDKPASEGGAGSAASGGGGLALPATAAAGARSRSSSHSAPGASVHFAGLPNNWGRSVTTDGRPFYFNLLTHETAWQKPPPEQAPTAAKSGDDGDDDNDDVGKSRGLAAPVLGIIEDKNGEVWTKAVSLERKVYYYKGLESSWVVPCK